MDRVEAIHSSLLAAAIVALRSEEDDGRREDAATLLQQQLAETIVGRIPEAELDEQGGRDIVLAHFATDRELPPKAVAGIQSSFSRQQDDATLSRATIDVTLELVSFPGFVTLMCRNGGDKSGEALARRINDAIGRIAERL